MIKTVFSAIHKLQSIKEKDNMIEIILEQSGEGEIVLTFNQDIFSEIVMRLNEYARMLQIESDPEYIIRVTKDDLNKSVAEILILADKLKEGVYGREKEK